MAPRKAMRKAPQDVQRPNTRAWARQQRQEQQQREQQQTERQKTTKETSRAKISQRSRPPQKSQRQQLNDTEDTAQQADSESKPSQRPRRPRRRLTAPAHAESNGVGAENTLPADSKKHSPPKEPIFHQEDPVLEAWFDQLPNSPFEEPNKPPSLDSVAMLPPQAMPRGLQNPSWIESTGDSKKTPSGRIQVTVAYLKTRGILLQPIKDGNTDRFNPQIATSPTAIREKFDELQALWKASEKEAEKIKLENPALSDHHLIQLIQKFVCDFDDWTSKGQRSILSKNRYDAYLKMCGQANEFVLQRTLMMSLFDPLQLGESLGFTCEASLWATDADALPTAQMGHGRLRVYSDKLFEASLRPNLVFTFRFSCFEPYTQQINQRLDPRLEKLMSVDDIRCFPFLFVEVKGATKDTAPAERANLHQTSRALYSIYRWMKAAEQLETFFKEVRIFSLVLNIGMYSMRVHRAIPAQRGSGFEISYGFDIVESESTKSGKDGLYTLVHNVLHNYGTRVLLPILKEVYDKVVEAVISADEADIPAGPYERLQRDELERERAETVGNDAESSMIDPSEKRQIDNAIQDQPPSKKGRISADE